MNDEYLIDLFIGRIHSKIKGKVRWYKPRSLSDAYSLARVEEEIHDLLKTKISSSSLHLSEAKDCSEVRNENFGLEGIDGVCEAVGKNKELESNESRIVDVKEVVNCEEDGKGHGSESSGVVNNNIDLHNHGEEGIKNKERRVREGVELTEFSPTGIGVHGHEYGFEYQLGKYDKHKESLVRNGKECDGEQEGNKDDGEWVLGVHLFGKCHDLRLMGNQECVNEGGDIDIRGLNVNGFLAYIRDGDDLLNQQKKHKGDVIQVTKRFIHVNSQIRNVLLVSLGYGMFEFGMLEWPKMKKASHVNFKFKSRSWKFDTWKWRKRKKIEQQTSRTGCDVRRSSGGDVNYKIKKIFVGGLPATLTEEQLQSPVPSYVLTLVGMRVLLGTSKLRIRAVNGSIFSHSQALASHLAFACLRRDTLSLLRCENTSLSLSPSLVKIFFLLSPNLLKTVVLGLPWRGELCSPCFIPEKTLGLWEGPEFFLLLANSALNFLHMSNNSGQLEVFLGALFQPSETIRYSILSWPGTEPWGVPLLPGTPMDFFDKQNETKEYEKKNGKRKVNELESIRTRTTPTALFSAMGILNADRKKCLQEMGFGSMIEMPLHEIPGMLVTPQSVHDLLGAPIGGTSIESLTPRKPDDPFIKEWKSQFGEKSEVRPNDITDVIVSSNDVGSLFNMNFLMLFANTMACVCETSGACSMYILKQISNDVRVENLDWCSYIY
ncbi:hypothetical protein Tco_0053013 [Tanacetum coccineum]